ncbi:MAG TPA: hypothetical protein VK582_21880 [Pyrinomonadaceae bacterium]|nr:hypothetical protein [Pyrinomonadaceae bacterium]
MKYLFETLDYSGPHTRKIPRLKKKGNEDEGSRDKIGTAMKTACFTLLFAFITLSPPIEIAAQSTASAVAFTGTWILDKEKTNPGKDFPRQLKSYKITVAENEKLLNVKSEVDGRMEIEISRDRAAGNSDIVSNPSSRSTAPPPAGGVVGTSLGTADAQTANYGGTMALFFTPNEASYKLGGEEVRIEIKKGDKVSGVARVRAKLDKSGNQIQFTTIRVMQTLKGNIEITMREVWKLSKDGKSLRFDRTVETPSARDEITMILVKEPQGPQ